MRRFILMALIVSTCTTLAFSQGRRGPQPTTQGRDLNTGQSYTITPSSEPPPKEWIDKETGHRVVRLSDEPGSQSLYFHQYCYSPDGRKLTFTSPTGIYQVDLETRKIEMILIADQTQNGRSERNNIIHVGRKTGRIFFNRTVLGNSDPAQGGGYSVSPDRGNAERTLWWIDPVSKEQHQIGKLPRNYNLGTVNCDETLLAGAVMYLDGRGGAATQPVTAAPGQRINLDARWSQHLPMALITMNAKTGDIKEFNPSNDWDNHFQFSPADPNVLMYCHEGPWWKNDRIWTINVDGTNLTKVHSRTMMNEIWGHEFWSPDGSTSWYQLSYGGTSWISGTNLKTKQEIWYHLERGDGSIHVNASPDGKLFCGDGNNGNPWIVIHRPRLNPNRAEGVYDASKLIQPGSIETERLVNMSKHQYALEPNPSFTPDMKWIVFRSNMFGPSYVFAVEVAKAG